MSSISSRNNVSRDYSAASESFYRPEDETEIRQEVDARDKIDDLDQEIKQKMIEIEVLKDRRLEKKIHDIDDKKNKLAARLEEIENTPKVDDTDKKFEAVDIRRRIKEIEKNERQKQEELYKKRKEQELERLVRKKMELEKIAEQKKKLNDDYRRISHQLEAINEEKESRDINNLALLDRALGRAKTIEHSIKNGALNEKDKKLLAGTYFEDTVEAKKEKERLLSEVQQHRFQEAHKANLDTKEKIKNLNDIRFALNEKHEELLKKKALQNELAKKGVDYLAQIEMGHTPPVEFIAKNMKLEPEKYRKQTDLNDIFRKGKGYIEEAQDKIRETIEEQEKLKEHFAKDPEYKGELKPFLEQVHPGTMFVAKYILEIILERAMEEIQLTENMLHAARLQSKHLESKQKKAAKKQKQIASIHAMKDIGLGMIEDVVEQTARDIAKEMYKINENSKTLSIMVVMRALRIERNYKESDNELQKIFFDMRGQEKKKKKNKFKFFFKDVQDIKQKDIKAAPRTKPGESKGLNLLEEAQDTPKESAYGAEELDPENCVENMGEFNVRKFELDYWDSITLDLEEKYEIFSKIKGGVQAIKISNNGHLMAVSTTNGIIGVVNLKKSPAELQLYTENSKFVPFLIKFSHDSSSQLLCLDAFGVLKVFLLQGEPTTKSISWLNVKDPELRPAEMYEYGKMDYKFLTRPTKVNNAKEMLQISNCEFFSQYTILGFQPNLLIGARNGLIMKFNTNKKVNGSYMKNQIFKTSNMKNVPTKDTDFEKGGDVLKPKSGPKESEEQQLYREFFVGHETEILFMGFIERPENILTMDKDGKIFIWKYQEQFLNSQNAFQTKERFKINMSVVVYDPVGAKNQIFPPKKMKVKDEKAFRAEEESRFRDYEGDPTFKERVMGITRSKELTEILAFKNKLPAEGQSEIFQILTMNYDQQRLISEFEQNFKATKKQGFVGNIQGSANNRFIYLQLILPHKIKPESNNVVYVGFNTLTNSLKKLKITLEVPKLDRGIDFIVQDNFVPLGSSYIYMLMRDGVYVLSLATGLIVKIFRDHVTQIEKSLRNKITFDSLEIFKNKDVYVASNSGGFIWRFRLKDSNDEEKLDEARNYTMEYLKLLNI